MSDTEAEALAKDLTVGEALDVQELTVKLRWNCMEQTNCSLLVPSIKNCLKNGTHSKHDAAARNGPGASNIREHD